MKQTVDTLITPETYLTELGIVPPAGTLRDPEHRSALYGLLAEHLVENGWAAPTDGGAPPSGLELRVLGTALHVRLGPPDAEEVATFAALVALVLGAGVDPAALSAGGVVSLRARIGTTNARYGERSVVDAVLILKRASARDVVVTLSGHPCRHPGAGCRYARDGNCTIDETSADAIAEHLAERQILTRETTVPPVVYRVAI